MENVQLVTVKTPPADPSKAFPDPHSSHGFRDVLPTPNVRTRLFPRHLLTSCIMIIYFRFHARCRKQRIHAMLFRRCLFENRKYLLNDRKPQINWKYSAKWSACKCCIDGRHSGPFIYLPNSICLTVGFAIKIHYVDGFIHGAFALCTCRSPKTVHYRNFQLIAKLSLESRIIAVHFLRTQNAQSRSTLCVVPCTICIKCELVFFSARSFAQIISRLIIH